MQLQELVGKQLTVTKINTDLDSVISVHLNIEGKNYSLSPRYDDSDLVLDEVSNKKTQLQKLIDSFDELEC